MPNPTNNKKGECCEKCKCKLKIPIGCHETSCLCHQKEEVQEGWNETESAMVSISSIMQTKDPFAIKLSAIQSILKTYTERILSQQREAGAEAERARIMEEVEKARTQFSKVENREVIINYIIKLISNNK